MRHWLARAGCLSSAVLHTPAAAAASWSCPPVLSKVDIKCKAAEREDRGLIGGTAWCKSNSERAASNAWLLHRQNKTCLRPCFSTAEGQRRSKAGRRLFRWARASMPTPWQPQNIALMPFPILNGCSSKQSAPVCQRRRQPGYGKKIRYSLKMRFSWQPTNSSSNATPPISHLNTDAIILAP